MISIDRTTRRAVRWIRKRAKRGSSHARLALLREYNRRSTASILGAAPVVVSLTSHGDRVDRVAFSIESVVSGAVKPSRVILWLDDEARYESRPESLRRLEARGLEIRLCENFGPHTKYFPYVETQDIGDLPLVTADDDILYPKRWLAGLLAAHADHPTAVSGYRVSRVMLRGDKIAPYDSWPWCHDTSASVTHFATGVSGVIYPVAMLRELAARGRAFVDTCSRADDIWLHWVALRSGTKVRQITDVPRHFLIVPASQEGGLVSQNVHQGDNDRWIAGLYTAEDVERLRASG